MPSLDEPAVWSGMLLNFDFFAASVVRLIGLTVITHSLGVRAAYRPEVVVAHTRLPCLSLQHLLLIVVKVAVYRIISKSPFLALCAPKYRR